MSIIGPVSSFVAQTLTAKPLQMPPPAKPAADSDGDADGSTPAASGGTHAVDIKA